MADESAFLARVAESPDDATVRLVYADWLEERGDPRAELLRADAEMRSLGVLDRRYRTLKARRDELKAGCDPGWLDAVGCGPTHRPLFTRLPDSFRERWRLADRFIDCWHGPDVTHLGYSEDELAAAETRLGVRLPAAVRDWYAYSGRSSAWTGRGRFVPPGQLEFQGGDRLTLRYENWRRANWYIRRDDLALPDPPVIDGDPIRQVGLTFSAFALYTLVFEVKNHAIQCHLELDDEYTEPLTASLTRADLAHWYWFTESSTFWEGTDIILERAGVESWYVSARTQAANHELLRLTGGRVERFE